MKTTNYSLRLDPEVKAKAEETFAVFGLNLSDAITVFLHKSILSRGFPFDLTYHEPNAMLRASIEEANQILDEYDKGLRVPFASAKEMFAAMDAEDAAEGYDV